MKLIAKLLAIKKADQPSIVKVAIKKSYFIYDSM